MSENKIISTIERSSTEQLQIELTEIIIMPDME